MTVIPFYWPLPHVPMQHWSIAQAESMIEGMKQIGDAGDRYELRIDDKAVGVRRWVEDSAVQDSAGMTSRSNVVIPDWS